MANKNDLEIGDIVSHWMYGQGKIIAIKPNSYWPYVIDYDKYGVESHSAPYLKLIKKGKKKGTSK